MHLEKIANLITPALKAHDVEFVGIFGSHARGEETNKSDLDLLVRFSKPKSLIEIIGLERKLSVLLAKKVEIITERSLHKYIAPYVMKDLQTIYGKGR